MTRLVPIVALLTLAALLAPPATSAPPPLYGVTWDGSLGLARIDRETLRPLPGRRVPVAREPLGWSFAPDRSRLALGSVARGAKLRLIDLRAMRMLGDVTVSRRGSGIATAWAGPRRVLSVVVTPGCCGAGDTIVAGVDAVRRRVLWRRKLGGSLQAGERFRRGLVLVLGPPGHSIGPSRLVRIGPGGDVRSAQLPDITSGNEPARRATESWNPGLAVDRAGGRAFVVQAEAPIAEVDLATMQARSHSLGPGARAADAVAGPTRQALWLGNGLLAVTGLDHPKTPAGLTLIDTRSWSARTIDTHTTDVTLAGGTLLAHSYPSGARGVTGYTRDGKRRFRVLREGLIVGVQGLGPRALVGALGGNALIDARTGRPLRRFRIFAMSLLSEDQPVLY
jgi:hypothetical protein